MTQVNSDVQTINMHNGVSNKLPNLERIKKNVNACIDLTKVVSFSVYMMNSLSAAFFRCLIHQTFLD